MSYCAKLEGVGAKRASQN